MWRRWFSVNGNQIRHGMTLEMDGKLLRVVKAQPVKPGKGVAYMQTVLKDLKTGSKTQKRFRATERVEEAAFDVDQLYQLLYTTEDGQLALMHVESFEQIEISKELIQENERQFIVDGIQLSLKSHKDTIVDAVMPKYMQLEVKSVDNELATLESGAVLKVPAYVKPGNRIKIDTADARYMERVEM